MTPATGDRLSVLVVAGGRRPELSREELSFASFVIAADSGYDHARALDLTVDRLVGDMDSISPAGLDHAEASGVDIVRHPAAKDQTDLELALDSAIEHNPGRIVVIGARGGRLDHQLANIALLAGRCTPQVPIELWSVAERVVFVTSGETIIVPGGVGTTVSLLPIGGAAEGVTTVGLRWPLREAVLSPFGTLGVSNVVADAGATVAVAAGVLAIIVNTWQTGP